MDDPITRAERLERYPVTDTILCGPFCTCWHREPGSPFVTHKPGCLCPCHGGRRLP